MVGSLIMFGLFAVLLIGVVKETKTYIKYRGWKDTQSLEILIAIWVVTILFGGILYTLYK